METRCPQSHDRSLRDYQGEIPTIVGVVGDLGSSKRKGYSNIVGRAYSIEGRAQVTSYR